MPKKYDYEKLQPLITRIHVLAQRRRNLVKFKTRFTNSIKGTVRWYVNGSMNKPFIEKTPESDEMCKFIEKHHKALMAGKIQVNGTIPKPKEVDEPLWLHIDMRFIARLQFDQEIQNIDKKLEKLAEQLPFADRVKGPEFPGFGLLNYALLIGTAGNLVDYQNPGKLWKQMGLAPITKKGITQAGFTWRIQRGLSDEEWAEAKYSPQRRAMVWNFGTGLLRAGGGKKKRTHYTKLYYDVKEYEAKKRPDLKPRQISRRARRKMEKRLLRDIWQMWREGCAPSKVKPVKVKSNKSKRTVERRRLSM